MTPGTDRSETTRAFERNALDPQTFGHADHVQVAFDLLRHYDFVDAVNRYANGIRLLAQKAGVPDKFNATITFAFLSLIAERIEADPGAPYDRFAKANDDLFKPGVLDDLYPPQFLHSKLARKIFLLPRKAA